METATVVSFLLGTVPAALALNMVELSGWALVFPRQMSEENFVYFLVCKGFLLPSSTLAQG